MGFPHILPPLLIGVIFQTGRKISRLISSEPPRTQKPRIFRYFSLISMEGKERENPAFADFRPFLYRNPLA
jgi:hypothetical protein